MTESMLSGMVTGDHHDFGLAVSGISGLCDTCPGRNFTRYLGEQFETLNIRMDVGSVQE